MVGGTSDWKDELGRWLKPFLDRLGHKARRQMCPLYVSGLIGPSDRKENVITFGSTVSSICLPLAPPVLA